MTIALVYNVKAEASPVTSLTVGQSSSTAIQEVPADPNLSSTRTPANDNRNGRVNDVYAEWDTMETINAVRAAIEERYDVLMVEADIHAYGKLVHHRPDFVFNMAEGLNGVSREGHIPAMLEMLQIPYLGSDPLTLGLCLDKARTKEILSYHGVLTAPFVVIRELTELQNATPGMPVMVKPLHEGSSKGIYNSCVARTKAELAKEVEVILHTYGQPALVEEFLPGREFTVALLGNGSDVRVLPIVEISFDALPPGVNPIYSYEAKWIWDTSEEPLEIFQCPARLDSALQDSIETLCRNAFRILQCRDWARIDVRLDGIGRPHLIEVNPLPGILPRPEDNSCFPKAARAAGISYTGLINEVLDIAMRRCDIRPHLHRERAIAMQA